MSFRMSFKIYMKAVINAYFVQANFLYIACDFNFEG